MEIKTVNSKRYATQQVSFMAVISDAEPQPWRGSKERKWLPTAVHVTWERRSENSGKWGEWIMAGGGIDGVRLKNDGTPVKNGSAFQAFYVMKWALVDSLCGEWVRSTLREVQDWQ